jgi:hypothetical protein
MSDFLTVLALHLLYMAACAGVVAAVVCRINEMSSKRHKLSWFVMYVAYAAYAGSVLLDGMVTREWEVLHLLGVAALGLNLLLTMRHWGPGKTPALSCKGER